MKNHIVWERLNKSTYARQSPISGTGLFAALPIPKGFVFGQYEGRILSPKELVAEDQTYYWCLENGKVIDGALGGNNTRFLNHSCNPNCEGFEKDGHVYFRAIRKIKMGQELTIDYNLGYLGASVSKRELAQAKKELKCFCGSKKCRGHMMDPTLFE